MPVSSRSNGIDSAVSSAVEFLMASRHRNDLWYDFQLAPGWSDEWVTGYVGDRLAGLPDVDAPLRSAWLTLEKRSGVRASGWGYNVIVPQDADSTAWALRLALHTGAMDSPHAQRGLESLALFRHANGLLGTYGPTEEIRAFIGADDARSFRGWTAPHSCVTAAAAVLPGVVNREDLLGAQASDGSWRSYWWPSDSFATALASEALGPCTATSRAADWVAASPWQRGTAFDRANDVLTCVSAGKRADVAREIVVSLLAEQRDDGSWAPGAVMRVPDPSDEAPWEEREWTWDGLIEGAIVKDSRGVFTTATVVHALTLAVRQGWVDD